MVDLGELIVGGGEADLQAFDFAEPAFAFGFGDAGIEVSSQSKAQRTQACSWMQGDPKARPPMLIDYDYVTDFWRGTLARRAVKGKAVCGRTDGSTLDSRSNQTPEYLIFREVTVRQHVLSITLN